MTHDGSLLVLVELAVVVKVEKILEVLLVEVQVVPVISVEVASDPESQVDVFLHDCDPFGVDCAEDGVFEDADEVGLCSFLKSF